MSKIAIIQSNYLPWKGYFDIINDVDLFIFYDDVQYTRSDWRNRNKIKTANGLNWITIPVVSPKGRLIQEIELADHRWQRKHWTTIQQTYSKRPHFDDYREFFRSLYEDKQWTSLSELNQFLIKRISKRFLGIETRFENSRDYQPEGDRIGRLIDLLIKAGATQYISGPTAKSYLNAGHFQGTGIELVFKDYSGYPQYDQAFPPFEHQVSIVDILFNCGPKAPDYIWGWRESESPFPIEDVRFEVEYEQRK